MALWLASILGLVILAHGPSQVRHVLSVQPIECDRGETFSIHVFCSERGPTKIGPLVLDAPIPGLAYFSVVLLFFVSSRSMLEKRWSRRELNRRNVLFLNKDSSGLMDKSDTLLTPNGPEKDIIIIEQPARARRSWKTTMLKATITTLILAILYIQMIFMTENIGYILSILGGVSLGTLVMGRYAPGATDANLHHT